MRFCTLVLVQYPSLPLWGPASVVLVYNLARVGGSAISLLLAARCQLHPSGLNIPCYLLQ